MTTIKIVAHRGASMVAPENTISSFLAAQRLGADAIEFDVQETSGGDLVVIHDYELARTTNGSGLVCESSTEYVRSLDAGSGTPGASIERVPSLEEVMDLAGLRFEIELKSMSSLFVRRVLSVVTDSGRYDRVEFTSPHSAVLAEVRRQSPDACIGLFARRPTAAIPASMHQKLVLAECKLLGAQVVHIGGDIFIEQWADASHGAGLHAHAANVDTESELRRVRDQGADQLSTNDCALAIATLR
jgi:glycerophosphoryl diester phosphodiesterase